MKRYLALASILLLVGCGLRPDVFDQASKAAGPPGAPPATRGTLGLDTDDDVTFGSVTVGATGKISEETNTMTFDDGDGAPITLQEIRAASAGADDMGDVDTLAELNAAITDATLLDDGAIADSTAIGLATGATYMNYGAVGDDSLNELFAAIDTAIGTAGFDNLTDFDAQTAWRIFYSNADGDTTELALGADGEYLKSNGASAAPTWAAPSGAAHDAVTLGASLGTNLLGLSTQELTLDTQTATYFFAGPTSGDPAAPTFRAIADADIPAAIARDTELPTASSLAVDDLITLSGVAEGAANLGTFTGTTIADNQTIKTAIQALESAVEGVGGDDMGDVDTLAELNSAITDATLLDDGAIASSTAIGLSTGATYTNYGVAGDDSLNEMFAAIDTALGIKKYTMVFDPKTVCDGAVDRLFLFSIGAESPNGIIIDSWSVSFEADPTTEADLDLKRADAWIGVANAAVMDVLDTTTGASSESTPANINSGAAVAKGKVIYLEFGTAYTETTHQVIFEMRYHNAPPA